jgi:hypothetical protein
MPLANRRVLCAGCSKEQPDLGRGKTCERCGCSPLPSYTYPSTSIFHPTRCNCVVGVLAKAAPLVSKPRKTPVPTLGLKGGLE